MLKAFNHSAAAQLGSALLVCSGFVLAGCNMKDVAADDYRVKDAFYERYPIKVEKAPVKMGIGTGAGMLQPDQINAVAAFARDAKNTASSRISVRYPSGNAKSRQMASDIAELLVQQGVPPAMIVGGSYPGSASSPVQLSFVRKVAVTRECGDWSQDMSHTNDNKSYPNFGCATQNNLAAMVANPEDFEHPRAMPPAAASARMAALAIYFGGGTSSAASSSASSSASSGSSSGASSGSGGSAGSGG